MGVSPKLTGRYYECEQCGKSIYRMPSLAVRVNHIFCSVDCKFDYRRGRKSPNQTGKKHPRWSGRKYCPICKTELTGAKARRIKTCGRDECANALKSQNQKGRNNNRWKEGQVHCKQCGIEITSRDRWSRTFCNRQCMGRWQSENLSGENSPIWKGPGNRDNETYSPEWTYKLRLQIRRRDGFECQNCGIHKRGLDVHHIDKDKWNCDPSNLISLCRSCHRFIEGGSIPCPSPRMLSATA